MWSQFVLALLVYTGLCSATDPSQTRWEQLTSQEKADNCDASFADLYEGIAPDLSPWKRTGISEELLLSTIATMTTRSKHGPRDGFVVGFRKGQAILQDRPGVTGSNWLMVMYMNAMLDLEKQFGDLIPDVDFVISVGDTPPDVAPPPESLHLAPPVFRFCKSKFQTGILIPIFHYYSAQFPFKLTMEGDEIKARHPWSTKQPKLFGRFNMYHRISLNEDPSTARLGVNGTLLCGKGAPGGACSPRRHFNDWSKNHTDLLDVDVHYVSMMKHAEYKYLLALDGIGLSSRMDLLLAMGGLVFREESGYRAYYYHLLKPHVNYIPFWIKVPEEILPALQWALTHDSEAAAIAEQGRQLAVKYLNRRARACFWFRLLKEYSSLLKYKVGNTQHAYMKYNMPVLEFLTNHTEGLEIRSWRLNDTNAHTF